MFQELEHLSEKINHAIEDCRENVQHRESVLGVDPTEPARLFSLRLKLLQKANDGRGQARLHSMIGYELRKLSGASG